MAKTLKKRLSKEDEATITLQIVRAPCQNQHGKASDVTVTLHAVESFQVGGDQL